jgi:hypothetical protein
MLRVLTSHKALEHPQLSAHVHDGDGAGLLAALSIAIGTISSAQPMFDRQQITAVQRRALRYQMHSSTTVAAERGSTVRPMAIGVQAYVTKDMCAMPVQNALITAAMADSSWRPRLL